jgi:hypothetical protein
MALTAAFVDRGRIVRRTKTAARVDGEKQWQPVSQDWFRCRFQLVKGSEQQSDGRRKRVVRPRLMVGRKIRIKPGDHVEIRSREHFGTELRIYSVDGEPEPMRKRRIIIGYEATLVRSE